MLGLLVGVGVASIVVSAAQAPPAVPSAAAIATAKVQKIKDNFLIITGIGGHQPVQQWKDLQEYQRFNADLLAAVEAAKKAGKSVDDAAASINLTTKYAGYESARTKAAIQAIYDELDKK